MQSRWRFFLSRVMDGNFKTDHMEMKNPEDDVWLTDGEGYFVSRASYAAHLKTAVPVKQVFLPIFGNSVL
jgi:hypothetical protein